MPVVKRDKQCITVGGVSIMLNAAIILYSRCTSTSNFITPRLQQVQYAPPVGFNLRILAIGAATEEANINTVNFGYGDNAVSAATPPTNSVAIADIVMCARALGVFEWQPVDILVPSEKYLYARIGAAPVTGVRYLGVLEEA